MKKIKRRSKNDEKERIKWQSPAGVLVLLPCRLTPLEVGSPLQSPEICSPRHTPEICSPRHTPGVGPPLQTPEICSPRHTPGVGSQRQL
jgi:hypothetical protein